MSIQDDYFDLKAELEGENLERFERVWRAFCDLEARSLILQGQWTEEQYLEWDAKTGRPDDGRHDLYRVLQSLRLSLFRLAQKARIRPDMSLSEIVKLTRDDTGWNTLVAELVDEIDTLQCYEDSPRSWLAELKALVDAEEQRELTSEEGCRYVELVEMLQHSNTEIPFGIEL